MQAGKLFVLLLPVAGCGAAELPQAAVTDTEAEIVAAQTLGANSHPQAALQLKQAKDQLYNAKKLANEGEEDLARMTLERARVDAELALALTQEAQARYEAHQVMQQIADEQSKH